MQVSYEMPSYVIGEFLLLRAEVLCLALAKVTLSGIVCGLYGLGRVVF